MSNNTNVQSANRACSLLYSYIKKHADGVWMLPVNVCPDVPLTFGLAGVPFEFVDIDSKTLCMDLKQAVDKLRWSSLTYSGMVYVRTYGSLKDCEEEFKDIKKYNDRLSIIDDRCLCLPEPKPHFYGSDMVLYSTGHCKQIDFGGGGLAFYQTETKYEIDSGLIYDGTDEEALYKKAYESGEPLGKIPTSWLKMTDYLTPDVYIKRIGIEAKKRKEQRSRLNAVYADNLPSSIQLAKEFQDWRFNIRVSPLIKDTILKRIFDSNLFASSHYHSVNRLFNNQTFPVSDGLYSNIINLFNDIYYTEDKAYRTCEIINKVMKENKFTPHIDYGGHDG